MFFYVPAAALLSPRLDFTETRKELITSNSVASTDVRVFLKKRCLHVFMIALGTISRDSIVLNKVEQLPCFSNADFR